LIVQYHQYQLLVFLISYLQNHVEIIKITLILLIIQKIYIFYDNNYIIFNTE